MTASNPALLPDPPLFDVTGIAKKTVEGTHRAVPARRDRAGPQRSPRDLKRRNRETGRAPDASRTARSLHRLSARSRWPRDGL